MTKIQRFASFSPAVGFCRGSTSNIAIEQVCFVFSISIRISECRPIQSKITTVENFQVRKSVKMRCFGPSCLLEARSLNDAKGMFSLDFSSMVWQNFKNNGCWRKLVQKKKTKEEIRLKQYGLSPQLGLYTIQRAPANSQQDAQKRRRNHAYTQWNRMLLYTVILLTFRPAKSYVFVLSISCDVTSRSHLLMT